VVPGDDKFLQAVHSGSRWNPQASHGRTTWQAKRADGLEGGDGTGFPGSQALCAASRLAHSDPEAEVNLVTDDFNLAVGAVLQQKVAVGWQPLAFFSRKLDSVQLILCI
jgi:hypothetical protein